MQSRKSIFAAAFLSATVFAGAAFAQNAWVEVNDNVQVAPFGATADEVDDWDVYNAQGAEIGDVSEVIGTDANTATALVIDFDDDAGYGDVDDVIIPLDQFSWENNRLVLNVETGAIAVMVIYRD